jgi:hypothetical protein
VGEGVEGFAVLYVLYVCLYVREGIVDGGRAEAVFQDNGYEDKVEAGEVHGAMLCYCLLYHLWFIWTGSTPIANLFVLFLGSRG